MVTPEMRQNLEKRVRITSSLTSIGEQELALILYTASLNPILSSKVEKEYMSALWGKEPSDSHIEYRKRVFVDTLSLFQSCGLISQDEPKPTPDNRSPEPTIELTQEGRDLIDYLVK